MRLAKIKNKAMYKSDNPNGNHYYLVFYNRKKKRYDAIQLTHLYVRDENRFLQVNKGNIKVEKFKEFDVPSGVKKGLYHIKNLNEKTVISVSKRYISKKQSNRIMNFINKKK